MSGGIEVKADNTTYTFTLVYDAKKYYEVAQKPDGFEVGICLRAGDEIKLNKGEQSDTGRSSYITLRDATDAEIGKIAYNWVNDCMQPAYPTLYESGNFSITTLLEKYNATKSENYNYFKVTSIDTTYGTNIYLTPYHDGDEDKRAAGSGADTGKNTKPQLSAFERSLRAYEGMIKAAPAGSTVKIVGDASFNALPAGLIQEFMKKGDVNLEFSYSYKGQSYTITIPAGTKLESGIPWYGPMYLWGHFGAAQ